MTARDYVALSVAIISAAGILIPHFMFARRTYARVNEVRDEVATGNGRTIAQYVVLLAVTLDEVRDALAAHEIQDRHAFAELGVDYPPNGDVPSLDETTLAKNPR